MNIIENNFVFINLLGIDGIEFIEYVIIELLVLGVVLECMGFEQVGCYCLCEVVFYMQGEMNVIVNVDVLVWFGFDYEVQVINLSVIVLWVCDVNEVYCCVIELGVWLIFICVGVMELNILGVYGCGDFIIYFVDCYCDFFIYDVDFKFFSQEWCKIMVLLGMYFFGLVQVVGLECMCEWIDFYLFLMGFLVLFEGQFFGILFKGNLLVSFCCQFYIQLVELFEGIEDIQWEEEWLCFGLGMFDVLQVVW